MKMLKFALLNLLTHKSKTIAMMIVISIGALITMLTLSFNHTLNEGSRRMLVESMSGDIVIYSSKNKDSIEIWNWIQSIKPMKDFKTVIEIAKNHPNVKYATPFSQELGLINDPDTSEANLGISLLGTNIDTYMKIFQKVKLIEGTLIPEDKSGILLSKKWKEQEGETLERRQKMKIGDELSITAFSKSGSQEIVKVKIYGIIESESDLVRVSLMDLVSFQKLVGYLGESKVLTLKQLQVLDENKEFLETINKDMLNDEIDFDSLIEDSIDIEEESNFSEIDKVLEVEQDDELNEDLGGGKSDFISVRVKDQSKAKETILKLNNIFKEKELPYKAVGYLESSGILGGFIYWTGIIVGIVIFIIQFISLVIITNAVLLVVFEKINEIGTMRAIGSKKSYIFKLLLSENLIMSLLSGIIGVSLCFLFIIILESLNIKTDNQILMIFFGGSHIILLTRIFFAILSVIIVVMATLLASIYPAIIATKISPLEAINKE